MQRHDGLRAEYERVRARAECLVPAAEVAVAVARLAEQMRPLFADRTPLVLCVMNGGFRFCSELLGHWDFPMEFDYLQATRYRGRTRGGSLQWLHTPAQGLAGRHVLVVDDILDEGLTLASIQRYGLEAGALTVHSAVLVDKELPQRAVHADYVALTAPERYLFGEGMDYKGFGRNLRGIYAVSPEDDR